MSTQFNLMPPEPGPFEKVPEWHEGPFAVFDVETTGKDPRTAHIVQAAFLIFDPQGNRIGGHATLVQLPEGATMDEDAVAAHGISLERIQDEGEDREMALWDLHNLFHRARGRGWPILIYNAHYDWPLVKAEWGRARLQDEPGWAGAVQPMLLDPLVFDRHYDKYRKGGRKLGTLAQHYGVALDNAHDAAADCAATAGVMRKILERYPVIKTFSLSHLQGLQEEMFEMWKRDMNAYWRRKGREEQITDTWPE
jgi:DNA polymerase-3 subunit epsilon